MTPDPKRWLAAALLAGMLGGCASGALQSPVATRPEASIAASPLASEPPDAPPDVGTAGPTLTPQPSLAPTEAPSVTPPPAAPAAAWRTAELRDVRTDQTFNIESLAGKVVVIEPMAMWCSNCREQQRASSAALAALDAPDVVYISLDVDPGESEADLARYADDQKFGWTFVVASREVARSLALEFGDGVLSPPSVPTVTVNTNGVAELHFGHRDADELEADLAGRLQ